MFRIEKIIELLFINRFCEVIEIKCPYCSGVMINGYIYGDRYKLKWLPEEKNLLLGVWARGCIELGEGGGLERSRVKASMCPGCGKLIIDMNTESSKCESNEANFELP